MSQQVTTIGDIDYRVNFRSDQEKEWSEIAVQTLQRFIVKLPQYREWYIEVVRKAGCGGTIASDTAIYRMRNGKRGYWVNIRNYQSSPNIADMKQMMRAMMKQYILWEIDEDRMSLIDNITDAELAEYINERINDNIIKNGKEQEQTPELIERIRDYHNTKKVIKAHRTSLAAEKMAIAMAGEIFDQDATIFALMYK